MHYSWSKKLLYILEDIVTETTEAQQPEEAKPLPELSMVDLYVQRTHKLQERQAAIAGMSCAIIENPEESVCVR